MYINPLLRGGICIIVIASLFYVLWLFAVRDEKTEEKPVKRLSLKTPLRDGDIYDFLLYDLLPACKMLASGRIKGDEYLWAFEESPIYTEEVNSFRALRKFEEDMDGNIVNLENLTTLINATNIGLFSISKLSYNFEMQRMPDGEYRCALTRLGVEEWRSPYGAICSRDEALQYYNACRKRINMVAKKVIGKPLTKKQKLKYVHDWLIISVAYDYKGLKARRKESESYAREHLEYLSNEYGAIVDGKAICEGYSAAFKAIIDELIRRGALEDVKCDIAVNDSHAWNRVWLDGEWFNVDVTRDDFGMMDFFSEIYSEQFLISDKKHKIKKYDTYTYLNDPATDHRYEKRRWTNYKKNLNECTVELKYPNKTYAYKKGKKIIPKVIVRYGKNVFPDRAYEVVRVDHNKVGIAKIKIVPSKRCTALCGSVMGPSFKIKKAK